jgi:acyl-CoA reductase-like NAD-dependent aldehyde dehydrogenase
MCDTTFVIDVIIVSGVVSVISPWNVPLHLSTRAVAPALVLSTDPS